MRTYIALDLEATGMHPDRDEVIEIGAVKFRDGKIVGRWESFVRPSQPIPYKVTQLTGIKMGDVARAPSIKEVTQDFLKFLGDSPVIGQSVELDLAMLAKGGIQVRNVSWDTFELATLLVPEAAVYNLRAIADKLGVKVDTRRAHRATADAELTMDVFLALRERIEDIPLEVLAEIGKATERSEWPLRHLFREVEYEKSRNVFTSGSSIRSQLSAKGISDAELDVGLRLEDEDYYEPEYDPEQAEAHPPDKAPLDKKEIERILTTGGPMQSVFPGYEHRPQQIEMAQTVADALNKGHHLIIEAGTGTGKSIGYLLPAILYSIRTGERVVVSTNTINLQDQLFHKDLPVLQKLLDVYLEDEQGKAEGKSARKAAQRVPRRHFKAALLKGKSNYICLRRWYSFRRGSPSSIEQLRVMVKLLIWLPQTATGDRNELLLLNDENDVWKHVSVSEEGCPLYECQVKQKGLCFFDRAKKRAKAANILVVNHALLLADLVMEGGVLPEYNYLIVDEAHNLEDEATDALGYTVDRPSVMKLLTEIAAQPNSLGATEDFLSKLRAALTKEIANLKAKPGATNKAVNARDLVVKVDEVSAGVRTTIDRAKGSASELFATLVTLLDVFHDEQNVYDLRQRITEEVRRQGTWGQLEIVWDNLGLQLVEVEKGLTRINNMLGDVDWNAMPRSMAGDEVASYSDVVLELRNIITRLHDLRANANSAITNPEDGAVYWLESRVRGGDVAVKCAPLHVGPLLDDYLFSQKKSVVLTSATLSTDNDFSYVRERLGLGTGKDRQLASPFDYSKSALVYVPSDMPEPGMSGYQRELEQTLIALCKASQGRALILFTSHSAVRATYRAIQRPLEESGIMVLGHNIDGSRKQLLERFKTNPRTVLLGTSSFWEGIDVVGDALSVLVIAKLPFSVPSDPVFAARSELLDNAFAQYSVPQAILKFKQGFGRLIRSHADRGVVTILDRRVLSKYYGQQFLNSLPDCTIKKGPAANLPTAIEDWLG